MWIVYWADELLGMASFIFFLKKKGPGISCESSANLFSL